MLLEYKQHGELFTPRKLHNLAAFIHERFLNRKKNFSITTTFVGLLKIILIFKIAKYIYWWNILVIIIDFCYAYSYSESYNFLYYYQNAFWLKT